MSVRLGFALIDVFYDTSNQAALAQEGFSPYAWVDRSWSRQDGVIDLFVGIWEAGNLLQWPPVAIWQQVVTGRIQDGSDTL